MIKRLRTVLLLVGISLTGTVLQAATITVGDFTYTTSGTKAKLTKGPVTGAVVIPDTIEHNGTKYVVSEIYSKAFQKTAITSVTVPATVTQIGSYAFESCAQLAAVTLAEGVQKIQSYAFRNCTALPEIHFPSTVTTISSYSFDGCVKLTSIVIPDKCNMLMSYPFQNCTSLRSITIGAKITSFSGNECKNCPLEEVLVSEGNTRLMSVDGVLYDNKMTTLVFFPWYKNVETFTLPATVTGLKGSFSNARYVRTFIGEGLTAIGSSQFKECPVLEKTVFGKDLSQFGSRCFDKSPMMRTVEIANDNPYLRCTDGVVTSADGKVLHVRFPFAQGNQYTAPSTLTTILPYAFHSNTLLEKVILPESVDSIGYNAFAYCSALTAVNIPAGVRDLADDVFYQCKVLRNMTLPDSLRSIGNDAFSSCYKLDSITLPAILRRIGDNAFYSSGLTSIHIPDSVREIGASAFEYCNLREISIGTSVDTIGTRAFRNYFETEPTFLIHASVPPRISMDEYYAPFEKGTTLYVSQAGYDAYKADSAYKAYRIVVLAPQRELTVTLDQPGTLNRKIAVDDLTGVVGLTVKGVMNGDDFAYMNRMSLIKTLDLTDVRIVAGGNDSVRTTADELPPHSVRGLEKLETIALPATLTAIADSALCSHSIWGDGVLRRADIPASVTHIGNHAFQDRTALESATLPKGLLKLGESAFMGCTSLTEIEIPASIDTLRSETFFGCTNVEHIKFNEGLKAIEDRALYNLGKITELVFPSTLDSIGNRACASLKSLTHISLPEGMRILNRNAFSFCSSLEEVHLPGNVEHIGSSCFSSCGKLTKINIPESVKRIDDSAFVMDSALLRIDIPRYVSYIGTTMFERCRSLRLATVAYDYEVPGEPTIERADSARLPAKVIGHREAFANCTSLEAIYIGSTIKFLGEGFLVNTPNLKRIFVANPVPPDMFADEPAFDRYDADLYVPKASIQAYRNNKHWKKFAKIHAIENQYNAVGDLFDDPDPDTVITGEGAILFTDPEATVSVTSIAGQPVYRGKARRLEVGSGMYIVRVNTRSFKVLVK